MQMDKQLVPVRIPARSPWCAGGVAILFLLPAATFLFSWYRPYLPDMYLHPAIDPALTVLDLLAVPILILLRALIARRRWWFWSGLTLAGGLLVLVQPLLGLVGSGLPALAYAATGLTSRVRQTSKRDNGASWILIVVGGPLGLLVWWFSFYLSYSSDFRFGPPPYVSTQPAYEITVRADLTGLAPERQAGALIGSRKVMLLRLKESLAGVIAARLRSNTVVISLHEARNQEETTALASSQGMLELVDLGDEDVPVGSKLSTPRRTVVSELRLLIVSDWRFDQSLLVRDVGVAYDQGGQPTVMLRFDGEGSAALREHTAANVGKRLGIAVDGVVLAVSRIESPIADGVVTIGGLSPEQARLTALKLRYGALAVPFTVEAVRPVTSAAR